MTTVQQGFGLEPRTAVDLAKVALFGVECEIESLDTSMISWSSLRGVETHDDNSLRNNGKEFVWNTPRKLGDSLKVFQNLHTQLRFHNKEEAFSERTSTHVHMNVRSLSMDDLLNLIKLYILFEECFFLQVLPSRRENIFCMPLTETHLPTVYRYNSVGDYYAKWSKYTALNLKRLGDLGTVEFRHLQGTDSAELMKEWLTTLENLYIMSQKVQVDVKLLTDKDAMLKVGDALFSHSTTYKAIRPHLFSFIENSIIDLKLSYT